MEETRESQGAADTHSAVRAPAPRVRTPLPTALLRRRYRELSLGRGFSLPRRLATTFGATTSVIVLCLLGLRSVELRDLWVVPATLLYGTLAEHMAHRWAMHHDVKHLTRIFLEHRVHHRHFTREAMHAEDPADFQMIMSSSALLAYFIAVFVLPPAIVPWLVLGRNAALIYVALGVGYFAAFELLHLVAHLDPAHVVSRHFPGAASLRRRHGAHHDPALQLDVHFNVVWPLADAVLGATERRFLQRNRP